MTSADHISARRRVHVAATVTFAAFLYVFSPMNLLVIGWFADYEDAISHRVHEVSIGALFALGFAGVVGQLRRRGRVTAGVQAVVALCVAAGVITASTGFEPLVFAYLIPPVGLIALDPEWRKVVSPVLHPDVRLLGLGGVLLVTLGGSAIENFAKARDFVQGHESHWGAMAAFSVATILLCLIAAVRPPGWRLAAWSSVGAVAVYAALSITFRFDASALGVPAAIGALLWCAAFAAGIAVASQSTVTRITRSPEAGLVAGVAVAIAVHTGWKVGWVRLAFAVPVVGAAAYAVLWLLIPSEGGRSRPGWRGLLIGGFLLAASVSVLARGTFVVLPLAALAALAYLSLRPLWAVVRRRTRVRVALVRVLAGSALAVALLVASALWLGSGFTPPNVPHLIADDTISYCASCHGVPGVARGAPVFDVLEHSGGDQCVSCHAHLPVSPSGVRPSAASWRLPLEAKAATP